MPLISIKELIPLKKTKQRLLGWDVGTKTIGVSVSDVLWSLASPLITINRKKLVFDIEKMRTIHFENQAVGWIIGLPINMDGTEGPRCQATRQFVKDILKHFDVPIVLIDERMSSQAVEKQMIEADLSRQKRHEKVNQLAAAFILQGALDYIQFAERES